MAVESLLESQQEFLLREVQEDASQIAAFELERSARLRFSDYYSSYLADSRKVLRTMRAAASRRRPILALAERLKLRFGPHPSVLDVGCGYGTDTMLLCKLGCQVVAVDPEPDFIAGAQRRLDWWSAFLGHAPRPRYILGRVEDLRELDAESFDGIFSAECLHHCEPVENALLAMRRLVNPAGCMLALESNAANPAVLWKRWRLTTGPRRVLCEDDGEFYIWGNENIRNARRWRRVFRECGFDTTRTRYSRHVLAEIPGLHSTEKVLAGLPGKALACIHMSFDLEPRTPGVDETSPVS